MQKAREWANQTRRWRWPLAFAAALVALAVAVFGTYSDSVAVCHDAVASASKVRLCEPPTLGDFVFLFIPALLLVLPDLSELSVLGVSLKRDLEEKVDETQGTANEQTAKLIAAGEDVSSRLADIEDAIADDGKTLRAALESIAGLEARVAAQKLTGEPTRSPPEPAGGVE